MSSKAQAVLSYMGILWLVAYFAGKNNRDSFSNFHLRQGLGLIISSFIFVIILAILMAVAPSIAFIFNLFSLLIFILMIVGILHAINNVEKPLPFIGEYFMDKFPFIENKKMNWYVCNYTLVFIISRSDPFRVFNFLIFKDKEDDGKRYLWECCRDRE